MRRIRYSVAVSADGYIAGPNGESDWIVSDPEIDFGAMMSRFDTALMGRRTYEIVINAGGMALMPPGMKTVVVSRTLRAEDHPGVTVIGADMESAIGRVRAEPGKDIWLFGGGMLFSSLLAAGLVDTVELGVSPVLLGGGLPLLPPPAERARLRLTSHKVYKTGIVSLQYAVEYGAA